MGNKTQLEIRINIVSLKKAILSTRLSQTKFCKECGLAPESLSRLFNKKTNTLSLASVIRICDFAEIDNIRDILEEYEVIVFNEKNYLLK